MDRCQRVEKSKADTPIVENEILITSQGRMRSYITYPMTLLQQKVSNQMVFKGMGRAINKIVTIVELIKRRIAGLHQVTTIVSTDITNTRKASFLARQCQISLTEEEKGQEEKNQVGPMSG